MTGEQRARAVFDYVAEEENELSFKEGDIITITYQDDSGWWEGELAGKSGLFPGNYVELIAETPKGVPTPLAGLVSPSRAPTATTVAATPTAAPEQQQQQPQAQAQPQVQQSPQLFNLPPPPARRCVVRVFCLFLFSSSPLHFVFFVAFLLLLF